MLSALKLNSFLSQPCVYTLVFPLGRCFFQTGTSERSGDRNILNCKRFKKYYRGAQSREATSPSNSQDPATQVLMLGCPQSHLSTRWSPQALGTDTDPAPAHGDLTALSPRIWSRSPWLQPSLYSTRQGPAQGGFPSGGLGFHVARLLFQAPVCAGSARAAGYESAALQLGSHEPPAQPGQANTASSQQQMGSVLLSWSSSAHWAGQLKTFCFHEPHIFINLDFFKLFFFPPEYWCYHLEMA